MNALLWTEPPEMTTAATNLLIVCICAVCAVLIGRRRQSDGLRKALWLVFYLIMIPTGVFGFAVHAVVMDPETKRIAWIFLCILLGLATTTLSISLFTEIFGRAHVKRIVLWNAAAEILFAGIVCLLSGVVLTGIHLLFIAYTGVVLAVLLVLLLRKSRARPRLWWYIAAILTAVAGGLFELCGDLTVTIVWAFDQGSACHLGIAAALCLFAAGCCRKE